jgi:hypothetical protein
MCGLAGIGAFDSNFSEGGDNDFITGSDDVQVIIGIV